MRLVGNRFEIRTTNALGGKIEKACAMKMVALDRVLGTKEIQFDTLELYTQPSRRKMAPKVSSTTIALLGSLGDRCAQLGGRRTKEEDVWVDGRPVH
jgi:hypothetical protein